MNLRSIAISMMVLRFVSTSADGQSSSPTPPPELKNVTEGVAMALANRHAADAHGNGGRYLLRRESSGRARQLCLCKRWRHVEAGVHHEYVCNVSATMTSPNKSLELTATAAAARAAVAQFRR